MKNQEWINKRREHILQLRREAHQKGDWGLFYGLALVAEELTEILRDEKIIKK